jgi:hypothetical protein
MKTRLEVWEIIKGNHYDLSEALEKVDALWPDGVPTIKRLHELHEAMVDAYGHYNNMLFNIVGLIGHFNGVEDYRAELKKRRAEAPIGQHPAELEEFEKLFFQLIRSKNVTLKTRTVGGDHVTCPDVLITGLQVADKGM